MIGYNIVPSVFMTLSYDEILETQLANVKELLPNWTPSQSDLMMIEKQATSYRELFLRAELNALSKAFFLQTATGASLDSYALFYGLERLQGTYPTATYTFNLTTALDYRVVLPKDSVIVDESGVYTSILLEDVVFEIGETTANGILELQTFTITSDIETTILQTPLPYISNITANNIFLGGDIVEEDDAFRSRIFLSFSDKSTAGAENTYKSYALKSDSRIEDVSVSSPDAGEVLIVVYVPEEDNRDIVLDRVRDAVNADDVRPLTDSVTVALVTEVPYIINAKLYIYENTNISEVYLSSQANLQNGLNSLRKIGTDITLSEINDFLKVNGVKKVEILSPVENIDIDNQSIAKESISISYEVYDEQL